MKHKRLIPVIAILSLVIGIVSAVNSFFVNNVIYFLSLGLIVLGLILLLSAVINYGRVNNKTAIPRNRWQLVLGSVSLSIIVMLICKLLFGGTTIYLFKEIF